MPNFDLCHRSASDGQNLTREDDQPDDFDGFPMFTPDGKRLVFCCNRCNGGPNETNVFIADFR